MSDIAIVAGTLSFIAGVFTFILSLSLIRRYIQRKQKPTIYLTFANLSWSMVCFTASYIYFFAGTRLAQAQIIQIVMYGAVLSATIFTFLFARKIFFKAVTRWYIPYVIVGILALIILALPGSNYVDYFPDDITYPAIILNVEYGLVLLIYLIPTMIGITYRAFKTAKKMEEPVFQAGFRTIGYGNIFVLGSFSCDTIASIVITDSLLYGLFLDLQWIFAIVATVLLFLGWTMPGWFKKLYHLPKEETKRVSN